MSMTIIDKIDKAKDPNRKNQDLEFGGQNTLLKRDKLSWENDGKKKPRLKYFKMKGEGDNWFYCYLNPGEEISDAMRKAGAEYVSPVEYFKNALGEEEFNKRLENYRNDQRALHHLELEVIRHNKKKIEDVLLGKK